MTVVEFALVAPVFFAALMGALDGGLLLFSANAVNHATGSGMIQLAQHGDQADSDTAAVAAVTSGGFSATGFAKLDEVDIFPVKVDATTGAVSMDTPPGCTAPCINRYDSAGNALARPWNPQSRSTSLTSLTNLGITVKTHYSYLAFTSASLTLSQTRYFRLEPVS